MQKKESSYLTAIIESHSHLTNEELIAMIKQLNEERKVDYCMALIQILVRRKTPLPKSVEDQITAISEIYTKTERCLKYFTEPIEGWRVNRVNDKNTISTKIINKSEVLIRFDGEVEIDIYNLCSMVYETSLYKDWIPFCGESKDIKTIGNAAKVAYLKFNLPFISDREGYFYGQGIDRMSSHGSIVVYCEGITGNKAMEKRLDVKLDRSEKTVDLDLKFLVVEIRMRGPGFFQVKAFGHLDIKMSFIPEFVLGYFSKKIGIFLIEKLIKYASNIKGSEWEKRINLGTDSFYPWLRKKVELWNSQMGKQIQPEKPPRQPEDKSSSTKETTQSKSIGSQKPMM